jgi:hypothetical protein
MYVEFIEESGKVHGKYGNDNKKDHKRRFIYISVYIYMGYMYTYMYIYIHVYIYRLSGQKNQVSSMGNMEMII